MSIDFYVKGNQFMINGEPTRIISGVIHYFRVVPEYWEDRLIKLKECGFNTVETYIPWNLHEPVEGSFSFEGLADIERFIKTAKKVGLYVIIRPSPYICAEWEFGGLPSWLLKDKHIRLRCIDPLFLEKVDAYYDVLMPILVPHLCTNDGPIIAMQIENEYGSYGNDQKYLQYLKEAMEKRGIDVLLFTSDGPTDSMLQGGMAKGVLATVNFGSGVNQSFDKLEEYQPNQPLMCMEFWNGWFDHWGEKHHTREAEDVAKTLDEMLKRNASVNFYVFHGGTNFGFYNGANHGEKYEPTITSYDYDVLLTEHGVPTEKYFAVRKVIEKYVPLPPIALPEPIPVKDFGEIPMTKSAILFDSLDVLSIPAERICPETMEEMGQDYGFIYYETKISGPRKDNKLILQDAHDRALVYLNGRYIGEITRWDQQEIILDIPEDGARLGILVENMGRINYGPFLKDYKGITEGVRLNGQFLFHWTIYPLPLKDLTRLEFTDISKMVHTPQFYKGSFTVDQPADTFLNFEGWKKGVAYINGFNLGRYWEIGPQQTLYIPAPLLKKGVNEIILFELHGTMKPSIYLSDTPVLEKKQ
ncbi:beta-galactosidase [Heyndrickxia shackletonii]|uniref:Beta-galactosidase n=1 Tax=Heyndrickxia shackletonii TaxID=157838 RepID=A0A0Q3TFT6_9BACI|nr:beta-galactosidase family protein [Heyndrickxia shackletonii]KQL52894.1 beta-galactosidase [Heyndrickxia shackletonii]NEY98928.1 beta-galactosidase [Heyndrickxia shackletonii]